MLTLEQLRDPSDEEASRFDLAEVDLTLATGLPGAERLDIRACLDWIDRAAAWVRYDTEGTFEQFRRNPGEFDNSEGTFRVVSMVSVLQRGLGVRYNSERTGDLEQWTDSRDEFIHGMIGGPGGTCASLPVLYVAVGRRLGYPMRLVTTFRHQFALWDGPVGERFNIEITNKGLNTFPDEYYRTWPVPLRDVPWWWRMEFLHSLSPRAEIAHGWQKRGFVLRSNGFVREAVKAFAIAWSLIPSDFRAETLFAGIFREWKAGVLPRIPGDFRRPEVKLEGRWYPGLPFELERDIIEFDVSHGFLVDPGRGQSSAGTMQDIVVRGPGDPHGS